MDRKLSLLINDIVYLDLTPKEIEAINEGNPLSFNHFINIDDERWKLKDENGE